MDPELRFKFFQALNTVRQRGEVEFTPYAVVLLTAIVESIGDRTSESVPVGMPLRDVQLKAIDIMPKALEVARKAYHTRLIDGLMVLTIMPRFMSDFCPPFEPPPNY
jgi:hypothetical protein